MPTPDTFSSTTPSTILQNKIDEQIEQLRTTLHEHAATWTEMRTPAELWEMEQELQKALAPFQTAVVGATLETVHQDIDFVVACQTQALNQGMRNVEWRSVSVRTLGGQEVTLETPYAARKSKKVGRPRRRGKRGRGGRGDYPVLRRLGIMGRATPGLLAEVNRQVADGPSEAEAQERLVGRGIVLDTKTMRRYVRDFAGIALWQRQAAALSPVEPSALAPLAGKRVIVAPDGGRLRTRVTKKGRRRTQTRHHGYHAEWREPKLFVIYTLDQRGRTERLGKLVYGGTLHGADACFALLTAQLRQLGIAQAQSLTIIGDGAPWIWNRVPDLLTQLDLQNVPVVQIIDWAHAVGKLAQAAAVGLAPKQRPRWLRRMRKALTRGGIDQIVAALRLLDDSLDPDGVIRKAIEYCQTHRQRMQYAQFEAQGLPIGSGAIESGIRRIVNLRMKGAGIFWHPENAERLLYLRCQIKAGRWLDFVRSLLSQWASDFSVSLAQVNQVF